MTLTAPGAELLPWDTTRCSHSAGVHCSGTIGCVVESEALSIWHDGLGLRWSHFVTDLRRVLGVDVEFFKTWELQARGALHTHAMMRPVGVTDRRFRAALRLCAGRNGFGRQIDVQTVNLSDARQAARTAGYCAKYAAKSADALPEVRRLNRDTGEIRCGGFRSWSASRAWGDTMASVHQRRRLWASTCALGGTTAPAGRLPGAGAAGALDLNQDRYASVGAGESIVPGFSSALLV